MTEQEQFCIRDIANVTGKTQSALIREAIDRLIASFSEAVQRQNLMAACGIWKNRDDLPEVDALRSSWDRFNYAKND